MWLDEICVCSTAPLFIWWFYYRQYCANFQFNLFPFTYVIVILCLFCFFKNKISCHFLGWTCNQGRELHGNIWSHWSILSTYCCSDADYRHTEVWVYFYSFTLYLFSKITRHLFKRVNTLDSRLPTARLCFSLPNNMRKNNK